MLLAIGAAVGVAAVVGLMTGFEPSRLPAALIDIAVYKLTFASAAGLLAAGAIVRRYAKREENNQAGRAVPAEQTDTPRLPGVPVADFAPKPDQRTDVRAPRQG